MICRLGYVGMPLILAAIDLKLSPSSDEMKIRQKRLDSLSKIIRLSESLYDVTDFVAAGTNHLLQLAYVTTQNFFLPSRPPSRMSNYRSELIGVEKRMNPEPSNMAKVQDPNPMRAKSWLDAFLRCPRAYLLISTSVDYSLAVGRLPYDKSLPALVRDIPAMGAMTQLPWTIDSSQSRVASPFAKGSDSTGLSVCEDGPIDSDTATHAAIRKEPERRKIPHDKNAQRSLMTRNNVWHEYTTQSNELSQVSSGPAVTTLAETHESMADPVNLDFFNLDVTLDSPSVIGYDSSIKSYDIFNSLLPELPSGKEVGAGRFSHTGIEDSLNSQFPAEGLDSILLAPYSMTLQLPDISMHDLAGLEFNESKFQDSQAGGINL